MPHRPVPGSRAAIELTTLPGVCQAGGVETVLPPPTDSGGAVVSAPFTLGADNRFSAGEALYVVVTDPDQDLDPFNADTVAVEVDSDIDREVIVLTETGASTGVFAGYLPSGAGTPVMGDCVLDGAPGTALGFTYLDPDDPTDQAVAGAVLDGTGLVFSAADGTPLNGAIVRLIDADTGQPATVFAADGVTPYPAELISGTAVAGDSRTLASGEFVFPQVPPGRYRLEVVPPAGFVWPSAAADAALLALHPGPFDRGAVFELTGSASVRPFVPLDPLAADLFVAKSAARDRVAIGDLLRYEVTLDNPSPGVLRDAVLNDRLPRGFRLVPESVRLSGGGALPAEPAADGRLLRIALPEIPANGSLTLNYVASVTPGARLGRAVNRAWVEGTGVNSSNTASAEVQVRDDLLRQTGVLLGEVLTGTCDEPGRPVPGVRILLETGTYVRTDEEGRYHIEGLMPGGHVVQMDTLTLPPGHEPVRCEDNNRMDPDGLSQFAEIQGGDLWRADFRLQPIDAGASALARMSAEYQRDAITYQFELSGEASGAYSDLSVTALLAEGIEYIRGSGRLAGEPLDPLVADDRLTFRVPDQRGPFRLNVRFRARVDSPALRFDTRAMTRFSHAGDVHELPAITAIVNLAAPGSLVTPADRSGVHWQTDDARQASKVAEPGRGSIRSMSEIAVVELKGPDLKPLTPQQLLPEVEDVPEPAFDRDWLAAQPADTGFAWPLASANPRIPAITVALRHPAEARPDLVINGALADGMSFDSVVVDRQRGVAVSVWKNVVIRTGRNELSAQFGDGAAPVVQDVWLSGAPVRAELDPEQSNLVADGITPPVVAVRLFDRDGRPARPGMTGEFNLAPPYQVFDPDKRLSQLSENSRQGLLRYRVRRDGLAYIALEPTSLGGEAVLRFDFDALRQKHIRARLKPVAPGMGAGRAGRGHGGIRYAGAPRGGAGWRCAGRPAHRRSARVLRQRSGAR